MFASIPFSFDSKTRTVNIHLYKTIHESLSPTISNRSVKTDQPSTQAV